MMPNTPLVNENSFKDPSTPEETLHVSPNRQSAVSTNFDSSQHVLSIFKTYSKHVLVNNKPFADRYKCIICPVSFKQKNNGQVELQRHLVNVHPEIFFRSRKTLPELSEQEFGTFCQQVLRMESCHSFLDASQQKQLFQCRACSASHPESSSLRHHLVLEHYGILEEKLLSLQQEMAGGSQQELQQIIKKSSAIKNPENPKEKMMACEFSSRSLPRASSPGLSFLPSRYKIKRKRIEAQREKLTCSFAEGGCGQTFATIYTLKTHKNKGRCSRMRKSLNEMRTVTSSISAEPDVNLPPESSCSILMKRAIDAASKIPKTSSDDTCEMLNKKQTVWEICKTYIKIQPDGHQYCSICNKVFPLNVARTKQHMVCIHPEVFFAQMKPQNQSVKIFMTNCQRILRTETNQARQVLKVNSGSVSTKRETFSCSNCNRKYTIGQDFKYHLVMEHYQFLQEKLLRLSLNGADLNPHDANTPSDNYNGFNKLVDTNGFDPGSFDLTMSDEPMMHAIPDNRGNRITSDPLEGDVLTYPHGTDATIEDEAVIEYGADSFQQRDNNVMQIEYNGGESREVELELVEQYLGGGVAWEANENCVKVVEEENANNGISMMSCGVNLPAVAPENLFTNCGADEKLEPLDIVTVEMESEFPGF